MYWPARNQARKAAKVGPNKYICAMCSEINGVKETILDHIEPIVEPKTGFVDWNTYIARAFPQAEGFQVLCKNCANSKTAIENELRKQYKKNDKVPDDHKKALKVARSLIKKLAKSKP